MAVPLPRPRPKVDPSGASVAPAGPTLNFNSGFPVNIQKPDRPNPNINFNQIITYQYPSDLPKYYMQIDISKYRRENNLKVSMTVEQSIVLPIPQLMVDSYKINYAEENISAFIGGFEQGIDKWGLENPFTSAWNGIRGTVESATQFLGGMGTDLQSRFGRAPNDFLTVILKGPTYKQYDFTWTMSPRNAKESETIRAMIALLNEKKSVIPLAGGAVWGYPSLFECSFMPSPQYLYRFKPAFLEEFRVNYTPNGQGAFYAGTGAPESVQIAMHFHEVEFFLAEQGDFAWNQGVAGMLGHV